MHQGRVVAAFQVHVRLRGQAVIEEHIEAVAFAERRDSAMRTIGEELIKLVLACQRTVPAERSLQISVAKATRRRDHDEEVAFAGANHDALGQTVRWDPGLGGSTLR